MDGTANRPSPVWTAIALVMLAAATVVVAAPAASASGGGGCGRPVTDEKGIGVSIRAFCFLPTVLRVAPGQTVTFRNRDPMPHTILGANGVWGSFDTLRRRQSATYRFVRPGVYPYVCTYHPGMVGVVVVGNAGGPGAAGITTTAAGPVVLVSPTSQPATAVRPAVAQASASSPLRTVPVIAGLGVLLVSSIALLAAGRRRRGGA
jgi:plastocyanin